jgi:hypothetical protein
VSLASPVLKSFEVVERISSWHNAHKKLLWCTERQERGIDFWIAFSEAVIIMGRLIREA